MTMPKSVIGRPRLGKPGSHKTYTLNMPVKSLTRLKSMAKKDKVSVSQLIRDAVEEYIQ